MNGIIRVFPDRNQYTPNDDYAFIGMPPMDGIIPEHREVHISCAMTWDKSYCEQLAFHWGRHTDKPVKLGGPAYGSEAHDFIQGMYIKRNIIFTTRGCNNSCSWCGVPKIEGKLRELPIHQGNIIQDNNFLQASRTHKDKVFDMLRTQKGICFKGGLECDLIDDYFVDSLNSLYYMRGSKKQSRISELWLACDTDASIPRMRKACEKLARAGFNRNKIYCYVLIGRELDMEKDEARCRAVYEAGAMPRAQLYRDFSDTKTTYPEKWEAFMRMWQLPAATNAHMKKGTDFRDFNT